MRRILAALCASLLTLAAGCSLLIDANSLGSSTGDLGTDSSTDALASGSSSSGGGWDSDFSEGGEDRALETPPDANVPEESSAALESGSDVAAEVSDSAGQHPDVTVVGDAEAEADADASTVDARTADGPPSDASHAEASDLDAPPGDVGTADDADAGGARVCTSDLSNIGTGDFRIAFTVSTQTTKHEALLNQRGVCSGGDFWDLRILATTGFIEFEMDDGPHGVIQDTKVAINDGVAHQIVLSRVAGTVTLQVDGNTAATGGATGALVSFGGLPALQQGTDVCDGHDGTQPLDGTITQVCVSH